MPYLRFPLRTVSPLLNKGTSKSAELRAPSVIGQIRFWLRAIVGASVIDSAEVYRIESGLLGSTSVASSVTIQVREQEVATRDVRVLPHSGQKRFQEEAFTTDSAFDLKLIFRPGTTLAPALTNALSLWLLLGGLGKRSRRMFGSVQLNSRPRNSKDMHLTDENFPDWWSNWEQIEQRPHLYPKLVNIALNAALTHYPPGKVLKSEPEFPMLHPDWCRVIVAKKGFDSAEQANIELFNVLRKDQYRRDEDMFGSGSPRRASPLIAQGRVFGGQYYPVFTVMRSPVSRYPKWGLVDDALDEIEQRFDGETVIGGKLNR